MPSPWWVRFQHVNLGRATHSDHNTFTPSSSWHLLDLILVLLLLRTFPEARAGSPINELLPELVWKPLQPLPLLRGNHLPSLSLWLDRFSSTISTRITTASLSPVASTCGYILHRRKEKCLTWPGRPTWKAGTACCLTWPQPYCSLSYACHITISSIFPARPHPEDFTRNRSDWRGLPADVHVAPSIVRVLLQCDFFEWPSRDIQINTVPPFGLSLLFPCPALCFFF